MKTIVYQVSSVKSAGATTFALNSSLLFKAKNPEKKVALLQFSLLPDLHAFIGVKKYTSLSNLFYFHDSKEWGENVLKQHAYSAFGVDIFSAPEDIGTPEQMENLKCLLYEVYDILFIDVDLYQINPWGELFFEETKQVSILSTLMPGALENIERVENKFKEAPCEKSVVINQIFQNEKEKVPILLKKEPRACLPFDQEFFWYQIFEGSPVVFQKKSKWAKALHEMNSL